MRNIGALISATVRDLKSIRPAEAVEANRDHINAAMRWLCRAQDMAGDGGLSAGYDLARGRWLASYPEVTGYTIPTFFDVYRLYGNENLRERALRMADWECGLQLECGAVMSGTTATKPVVPAVFDTGQVIFGWLRAFEESREEKYLRSAERAGRWLCEVQDSDGAWRKYGAVQVKNTPNVYNTRTAWSLCLLHAVTGDERFRAAAMKNISWAVTQQKENGWFDNNDFEFNDRPLTHTIGYAVEGMLEAGVYLQNDEFVGKAGVAARALLRAQRNDGAFSGRFAASWQPAARWSCLSGNAQIALIFFRFASLTGEAGFRTAAERANAFLRSVSINSGVLSGSYPIYGAYEAYRYPAWAIKFFVDTLVKESD